MKYILFAILFVIIFVITGCSAKNTTTNDYQSSENSESDDNQAETTKQKAEYKKITADEAKSMMEKEAIVIDVREEHEYADGHIEDAILSPLGNIENDIMNITTDKDANILIYCRSGNRSKTASLILIELGYTNVYDFGGIIDWKYQIIK